MHATFLFFPILNGECFQFCLPDLNFLYFQQGHEFCHAHYQIFSLPGVHGALMVYEVRFTSELLASLLSIPSGKTLLRRHLNTHFKELVGRSVVQEKRELEASSGYTPLTTSAKVKVNTVNYFVMCY